MTTFWMLAVSMTAIALVFTIPPLFRNNRTTRIDRDQLNAELIKAEAILGRDKTYYERQKQLFDEKLISREQLEAAKAQLALESAQLTLETLQNNELEQALALQNLQIAALTVAGSPKEPPVDRSANCRC